MALGALRSNVIALVFRATAVSVGTGIMLGITLTLLLHKLLKHWATGSAEDSWGLLIAVIVLTLVASVASGLPARRAARIDPMEALRYQ